MTAFRRLVSVAAPMMRPNIDTDTIMPKRFLKGIDRSGLERGVFADLRHRPDGTLDPDFVLNRPAYRDAQILITGPNFGCGSSREHAVWGLLQLGIRTLIGTSFAGIFRDNALNAGLLVIELDATAVAALAALAASPSGHRFAIDIVDRTIRPEGGEVLAFEIDADRREQLLRGIDPVGLTLAEAKVIRAFQARHYRRFPWLQPAVRMDGE